MMQQAMPSASALAIKFRVFRGWCIYFRTHPQTEQVPLSGRTLELAPNTSLSPKNLNSWTGVASETGTEY
jgi:hypothetical protein